MKSDPSEPTPYERFERLTKRLVNVPKKEINGKERANGSKKKVEKKPKS